MEIVQETRGSSFYQLESDIKISTVKILYIKDSGVSDSAAVTDENKSLITKCAIKEYYLYIWKVVYKPEMLCKDTQLQEIWQRNLVQRMEQGKSERQD